MYLWSQWFSGIRLAQIYGTCPRSLRIYHGKALTTTMFCNRCGTSIPDGAIECPRCQRRIGDPVRSLAYARLQGHLHTLAILWIVTGALFIIPAALLLLFGGSVHLVLQNSEPMAELFPVFLYLVGGTLALLGIGGIGVGLGLKQHQPWARIVAIILGVLALFHPPFGTALGVYTLWVLLADDGGHEYHYLAQES